MTGKIILKPKEERLLKRAMEIFFNECLDPHSIEDPGVIITFFGLRGYVKTVEFEDIFDFEMLLARNVELAEESLRKVSKSLAEAHKTAGRIELDPPSVEFIKELRDNLIKVNKEIEQDKNFHIALKLAGSIADILERRMAKARSDSPIGEGMIDNPPVPTAPPYIGF